MDGWIQKKVLITVKTYPTPAWKGGEVSCIAGITDDNKWIRLFPVPFRRLEDQQKFKKYQWIEANIKKASSDTRQESYRVDIDSIKVLSETISTADYWQARKQIVLPLLTHSMCELQAKRDSQGFPTLGIIRPKTIDSLIIEPTDAEWSSQELARLNQLSLIDDVNNLRQLEKIPYIFKYKYFCEDDNCSGHNMQCSDWEISAAYRSFTKRYGNNWEIKFHEKFEYDMLNKRDIHFYVGTIHGHPNRWIITGLFYPIKCN